MTSLSSFLGYQPHICPKHVIWVKKAPLLEIDHFDILDFEKSVEERDGMEN